MREGGQIEGWPSRPGRRRHLVAAHPAATLPRTGAARPRRHPRRRRARARLRHRRRVPRHRDLRRDRAAPPRRDRHRLRRPGAHPRGHGPAGRPDRRQPPAGVVRRAGGSRHVRARRPVRQRGVALPRADAARAGPGLRRRASGRTGAGHVPAGRDGRDRLPPRGASGGDLRLPRRDRRATSTPPSTPSGAAGRRKPPPSRGHIPDYVGEEVLDALRQGKTVACADTDTDPRTDAEAYRAAGMRSWIKAPFRRDGDLRFTFCVADPQARDWRDDELELLRDVAVRVLPRLERARAEEALRVSEERFRLIVTTANEGIALCDAEDTVTFVNETLASWLGHTPDEMIGRAAKEFLSPADRSAQPTRMDERRRGVGAHYDARLKTGDGDLRWFLVSATPVLDDDGELPETSRCSPTSASARSRRRRSPSRRTCSPTSTTRSARSTSRSGSSTGTRRRSSCSDGRARRPWAASPESCSGPRSPGSSYEDALAAAAARRVVPRRGPVPAQGRPRVLGRRALHRHPGRGRRRGGRGRDLPRHRRAEARAGGARAGRRRGCGPSSTPPPSASGSWAPTARSCCATTSSARSGWARPR